MAKSKEIETQLAIIGAGPGGYAAAFHAAEMGMDVVMVTTDEKPGGVCLHRGCIPSKALLHVARMVHETQEAEDFGVKFNKPKVTLSKLRDWKNSVIDRMSNGLVELANRRNVRVIRARAQFADSGTLKLEGVADNYDGPQFINFQNAIIATGSKPAMPGLFNIDSDKVMDSTSALNLDKLPKTLLVIGGGYIGLEMGTFYSALGTRVSVVEMLDALMTGADRDLVRPLQNHLEKHFESIWLGTKVKSIEETNEGILVKMEGRNSPDEETFERVLVSVGRWPNSARLGLEETRVEVDEKGFIKIDNQQRTADPRIFAIGDVAGEPLLAHKASREGKVAVEVIAGKKTEFDNTAIPAVVFTDPEVAWCGLTETEAKEKKIPYKAARFSWAASGRAMTLGRTDGMTKILFDPDSDRVLGVGIVGVGAGELISEGVLACEMAAVAHDLADTIHPHPTLSETVMESAEAHFGYATHIYRPKR